VPDGAGAWLLPRLVGMQRAKELMMLGEDVPSARAERLGLVNSVVPAAELTAAARDLAVQLAQGPSAALALTKRLLNQSFESDRGSALDAEATAVELVRATSDAQEGIEAFLERRQPRFRGW
jgi:2-(1,2-epoxy-1,2-dihydrophenyl)acetyl-CoA isomerase